MDIPQRIGRYEILGELAAGGMAQLLLARAHGPNRFAHQVAIKWLLPELAGETEYRRRFAFEAQISGRLTHPNLVPAIDVGIANRRPYMVLEYVRGWSLRALWATAALTRTAIPMDVALSVLHGAAGGLHFAHELRDRDGFLLGLVHRDVSPFNVVLGDTGHARVLDFGIATTAALERSGAYRPVLGTSRYVPPEVLRGQPADRRADVYSLGVLMYELTTGREHLASGNPAPSAIRGDYPPVLESVVLRALSREPERRHRSAEELQLAIEITASRLALRISPLRTAYFLRELFEGGAERPVPPRRRADTQEITTLHPRARTA